ncbi:hypothetical protein PJ267_06365 [Arthrobacter sp. OVS8]|nr:hypothetical protein PJ267_06365 [Arthrobacter sp. OVS8]
MFAADLATGWAAAAVVVAVVVAASALVAAHRTDRAGVGPLGVTRALHEKTPPCGGPCPCSRAWLP